MDLENRLRQLETLITVSGMVNSSLEPWEIRERTIKAATRLLDAEAGSLLLIDHESGELFFEVAVGGSESRIKEVRLKAGQGIAGWVAEKGESVIIHDVRSDPRFFKGADEKTEFVTKNIICVPVKAKDKILGVLEAINKREGRFDKGDLEVFIALANQVAIAIENSNLYQELKEAFYGIAEALAETIEMRDPYTGGHTRRVMNYSLSIGMEIGLSKEALEKLKLSAILHDIGKIGIRDDILLKKGRLDQDEFEKMCMHPGYGAEILDHIKQLKYVIPGVRSHHEKYNGKGYPDHLMGEEIPVIARIIAVADSFDAMTTNRPYRNALSREEAFKELCDNKGIQFDANVVEAFLKVYKEME
ncbi:MAG: phosphohydrolase [Nitrospirae bacterium RIFCSPLOW2_12_42_9]|nr:MAG: phosphohydrolase [Nitrospirae bacterium RIFCSPHIGHO2_02_FULL_42_12]OGW62550.1 MAG: phosphohydrolase [Nitrospirae bacterium RIFCSPLOW2_12_42_9]